MFSPNSPSPPLVDIVLFGLSLKVFKTRLLGRDFHTLINNALFPSPTDVGSHNRPPLRLSVFVGTSPDVHSLSGLSILAGTLFGVHPLLAISNRSLVTVQTHC